MELEGDRGRYKTLDLLQDYRKQSDVIYLLLSPFISFYLLLSPFISLYLLNRNHFLVILAR